jgi:asparagine synthase (glutamine-hydrolysing)
MWARQIMQSTHIKKDQRQKLWGERFREIESYRHGDYYVPPNGIEGVNQGFYFDLMSYLPGDILVKVDRAAMAHGLETRAPFLDRDLAEFALSLPASLKVNGLNTKVLLQEACSRYWPEELQGRNKQGFGPPIGVWLNIPVVRDMTERVFSTGSPLRALLPGINMMYAKRRDYRTGILLTLGLWLERNNVSV